MIKLIVKQSISTRRISKSRIKTKVSERQSKLSKVPFNDYRYQDATEKIDYKVKDRGSSSYADIR